MARLNRIDFPLRGDYITLDALLKATSLAPSGGAAKAMVAEGLVQVDGQQELRKTAKLRLGQVVSVAGARVRLVADTDEPASDAGEAQSAPPLRATPAFSMTLKKTDLARQMQLKIEGQLKGAPVPGRFGQPAGAVPDRKEQRKLDAAAGLVPFACKLPSALNQQLRERAAEHEGGMNGLVAELLTRSLG